MFDPLDFHNMHTITIRVRYSECDPMGVAHHTAYPVWFEMGRTELLRGGGRAPASQPDLIEAPPPLSREPLGKRCGAMSYRDLEDQGIFLAVVSLEVRYKKPARYDDLLMLETTLTGAGHVKIEHEYKLLRDNLLLASGATTLACLDRQGRLRPLPEFLMQV